VLRVNVFLAARVTLEDPLKVTPRLSFFSAVRVVVEEPSKVTERSTVETPAPKRIFPGWLFSVPSSPVRGIRSS
jgi:hypothetical protein